MGHIKLNTAPNSKRWRKIIDLLNDGADAAQVARATIYATQRALTNLQDDSGFRESLQLLVAIGLAGGKTNPADYLRTAGIHLPAQPSITDLALAISQTLERRIEQNGKRSDFGTKARNALIASVVEHVGKGSGLLLDGAGADAATGLRGLDKEKAFGEFGRSFFSKLMYGTMDYFLSRTLSTHVGEGKRFTTLNQLREFERDLRTHCEETSVLVKTYSGQWLKKNRPKDGGHMPGELTDGFGRWAIEKMRSDFGPEGKRKHDN